MFFILVVFGLPADILGAAFGGLGVEQVKELENMVRLAVSQYSPQPILTRHISFVL